MSGRRNGYQPTCKIAERVRPEWRNAMPDSAPLGHIDQVAQGFTFPLTGAFIVNLDAAFEMASPNHELLLVQPREHLGIRPRLSITKRRCCRSKTCRSCGSSVPVRGPHSESHGLVYESQYT